MRFLAFLIAASVILSLARALTPVLALLLLLSLVWAVITKPLELFGFVTLMLLTDAVSSRPTTIILCVAFVATVIAIQKPIEKDA